MIRSKYIPLIISLIILLSLLFMGNGKPGFILKGAGATFPHPLYKEWINIYEKDTGIRISYQAIGSGGGIKALLDKEVDFGATDAFLSDGELKKIKSDILHIPTCLGAVVIIYNLPGKPALRLTPQLLGDIFMGKISRWSSEKIAKVNPGLNLPDMKITVVHRSESSGTTFIFTNYLAKISSQWKERVGAGKLVRWPAGAGVEKNPGVARIVKKIEGAIGYVELNFAVQAELPTAKIQNKAGNFIKPDMNSMNLAAQIHLPVDTRTLIIDTSAPKGYPISAFTWLIFYKEQNYDNRSFQRAKSLTSFLWWVVHDGQRINNRKKYGTLSSQAVVRAENIIRQITYNGNVVGTL